jgi:hypothetical protein
MARRRFLPWKKSSPFGEGPRPRSTVSDSHTATGLPTCKITDICLPAFLSSIYGVEYLVNSIHFQYTLLLGNFLFLYCNESVLFFLIFNIQSGLSHYNYGGHRQGYKEKMPHFGDKTVLTSVLKIFGK